MTTKRFLTGLVALALILSAPGAFAASANASTNVSITVPAFATISLSSGTTNLTYSGSAPAGTWSGTVTATYSCRTSVGSTGNEITLSATAASWTPGTTGSVGPNVGDLKYTTAAGANPPPGVTYTTSSTAVQNGTETGVVTGIAAKAHISGAGVVTTFTVADNAAWDADSYTLPVRFTITAN